MPSGCCAPRSEVWTVPAAVAAAGGAVVVQQAAGRPVLVLGRVAAARAVEGRDVLERHEDVAVQLDVGDFVDVAVRSEDALLVFAAEEGDLDLLALVLARVVLHHAEPSGWRWRWRGGAPRRDRGTRKTRAGPGPRSRSR